MRLFALSILALASISCTLATKLTLLPSGSLGVEASIAEKLETKAAWKNLEGLDPSLPDDPFDASLWRQGLGPQAKIVPNANGTTVSFTLSDPQKLLPGLKITPNSWELSVDRAALRNLASLSSWGHSPALDSLLPSPETIITENDYRELLVYLLGPGTSPPAARTLIDASWIEITVVAPKPLVSAEGAVSVVGNQAVYRWPLIRVLTLETPLHLRLTY